EHGLAVELLQHPVDGVSHQLFAPLAPFAHVLAAVDDQVIGAESIRDLEVVHDGSDADRAQGGVWRRQVGYVRGVADRSHPGLRRCFGHLPVLVGIEALWTVALGILGKVLDDVCSHFKGSFHHLVKALGDAQVTTDAQLEILPSYTAWQRCCAGGRASGARTAKRAPDGIRCELAAAAGLAYTLY